MQRMGWRGKPAQPLMQWGQVKGTPVGALETGRDTGLSCVVKINGLAFPPLSAPKWILHYLGPALPKVPVLGFLLAMGFVCTLLSFSPNEMYLYPEFLSLPALGCSPVPLQGQLQ